MYIETTETVLRELECTMVPVFNGWASRLVDGCSTAARLVLVAGDVWTATMDTALAKVVKTCKALHCFTYVRSNVMLCSTDINIRQIACVKVKQSVAFEIL